MSREIEALMHTAGFNDEERKKYAAAMQDPAIGITTLAHVSSWNRAGLVTNFGVSIAKLIADLKAKDNTLAADAAEETKLVLAVRTALQAEKEALNAPLRLLGVSTGGSTTTTQLVLAGDATEPVTTKAELEQLQAMEREVNGGELLDFFNPSLKMVSFFSRGFKRSPPTVQWYKLEMACCDFEVQQNRSGSRKSELEVCACSLTCVCARAALRAARARCLRARCSVAARGADGWPLCAGSGCTLPRTSSTMSTR
jgi:hypothetical protein